MRKPAFAGIKSLNDDPLFNPFSPGRFPPSGLFLFGETDRRPSTLLFKRFKGSAGFCLPFLPGKRDQESAVSCGAMTNSQHLKLGFIAYRRFPRYFLRLHLKFYRFRSTGWFSLKGLCFHGRKNSDLGLRKDSTQVVKTAPDIDAIIVKAFQNDGQRQVLRGECTEYERINQMVV